MESSPCTDSTGLLERRLVELNSQFNSTNMRSSKRLESVHRLGGKGQSTEMYFSYLSMETKGLKFRFSTTGKIKFVASNYFSIRANTNTACEKNFAPIWHQNLQKRWSYWRARFYVVEGHRSNTFVP